jgi:hypothetical protein
MTRSTRVVNQEINAIHMNMGKALEEMAVNIYELGLIYDIQVKVMDIAYKRFLPFVIPKE